MARMRCEFCHKYIDVEDADEHDARHLARRPDGQQTDYVTVAPSEI